MTHPTLLLLTLYFALQPRPVAAYYTYHRSTASRIVGIIFAVLALLSLIACFVIARRRRARALANGGIIGVPYAGGYARPGPFAFASPWNKGAQAGAGTANMNQHPYYGNGNPQPAPPYSAGPQVYSPPAGPPPATGGYMAPPPQAHLQGDESHGKSAFRQ
ncbi:hypothetical protein MIND_01242900 [Mycena indigotica]|uniref:Uncharacterized protein n=1 Tax=Mycena indigotica TaxID=2126181 RepID=A0A8H6S3D1_9AGAR|nr:uncharacterized protein MIND_01242900 [Mycena indigotica]KAF7292159.1 hypothetical protein MIND_01242900 [Mycena indigotica]